MENRESWRQVLRQMIGKEEKKDNTPQAESASTDDSPQRAALRNTLKRLIDGL